MMRMFRHLEVMAGERLNRVVSRCKEVTFRPFASPSHGNASISAFGRS